MFVIMKEDTRKQPGHTSVIFLPNKHTHMAASTTHMLSLHK